MVTAMTPQAASDAPAVLAQRVVQSLLHGAAPNGTAPEACGSYRDGIEALYAAHARGGTVEVRRVYDQISAIEPAWIALVAADLARPAPIVTLGVPALPERAQAVYAHAAPCAAWLDETVAFLCAAYPMTPRSFHESGALWLTSLALSRRLCVRAGASQVWPNIFAIYIADSGRYKKSTAMEGYAQLLFAAGLDHLLVPSRVNVESLIDAMSTKGQKIPAPGLRDRWLKVKASAGQRGWLRDEISGLFTDMGREYKSGLLELMLELYDAKEVAGETVTISRGENAIEKAYFTVFGSANPATIGPHLGNAAHWHNGLWARFALLTPLPDETAGGFHFWPDPMEIPSGVINGLKHVYNIAPVPWAEVTVHDEVETLLVEPAEPLIAYFGEGAWDAWKAYSEATWELARQGDAAGVSDELQKTYDRLGTQLIKVAMLLAAMDADPGHVVITLPHMARAQTIVERWRWCAHNVRGEQSMSEDAKLMSRIERQLKLNRLGLTEHDLNRALGVRAKSITELLHVMESSGIVMQIEGAKAANGRKPILWTLTIER